MHVTETQRRRIFDHAAQEAPRESCGVIVRGKYRRCQNIAVEANRFRIAPEELAAIRRSGRITAIIHSHPAGPDCPTAEDMRQQVAGNVPWGIVTFKNGEPTALFFFGDQVAAPPLLGRPFRHGVTDCYSLIRDYYRIELGIDLSDFPRDDEWWMDGGQDLYRRNFRRAGFREIPLEAITAGDVLLAEIPGIDRVSHGGVYLGRELILHHLPARLSSREPLGRWRRHVRLALRHDSRDNVA